MNNSACPISVCWFHDEKSNSFYPFMNFRSLFSYLRRPTSDLRSPTSDVRYPISVFPSNRPAVQSSILVLADLCRPTSFFYLLTPHSSLLTPHFFRHPIHPSVHLGSCRYPTTDVRRLTSDLRSRSSHPSIHPSSRPSWFLPISDLRRPISDLRYPTSFFLLTPHSSLLTSSQLYQNHSQIRVHCLWIWDHAPVFVCIFFQLLL